jgi:hypothetical protein
VSEGFTIGEEMEKKKETGGEDRGKKNEKKD